MRNLKVREGVVLLAIKGTYLLVSDKSVRQYCRYVWEINGMAAEIWQDLAQGRTEEEIVDRIMNEYVIEDRTVPEKDVHTFLTHLEENGYLTGEDNHEI